MKRRREQSVFMKIAIEKEKYEISNDRFDRVIWAIRRQNPPSFKIIHRFNPWSCPAADYRYHYQRVRMGEMRMAHGHGSFVWYELMTTDMEAAEAFYRDVIGWDAQDAGVEGIRYTMFTVDGRPVSGSMALPDSARSMGNPPLWLGYIAVDDVDTLAADIVIDGGVVHRAAADIPGIGRFAIVGDPQGAAFALYKGTGGDPAPTLARSMPGLVGWHELDAEDGAEAFEFYAHAFGWTESDVGGDTLDGDARIFAQAGEDVGAVIAKPETMPVASWLFHFNVPVLDEAVERVRMRGGMVLSEPTETPRGWSQRCLDPQGAMFALVAPER